jgi:hypothetical protein
MKNIHILPTDKPSRLYQLKNDILRLDRIFSKGTACKNIYITSDEEIKNGDWCVDIYKLKNNHKPIFRWSDKFQVDAKKIILTTDQDLIKDGVQPIDDEFLEWFVKNPSCEEVELANSLVRISSFDWRTDYKIIIPKQEQKQHLIDMMKGDEELGVYDESREIKVEDIFNDEKREKVKRVILQHKVLQGLSLVSPAHLQMTSNGHGEFPDSYKLTEKGIQYIIEQLNKE